MKKNITFVGESSSENDRNKNRITIKEGVGVQKRKLLMVISS